MAHQSSGAPAFELAFGQFKPMPITIFNGSTGQDFSTWLRRFEDLVRMVNPPMPEQLKVNNLVGYLDGEARDLVEEMPDADKNDYTKVVSILRTHYEAPHFRNLARQQLSDCKQGANETVRDFAERMKKLVRKVTQGQTKAAQKERLLDEFLDRIKPTLRFHVKASGPSSYDDAVIKAMTYESLLAEAINNMTIIPSAGVESPAQVNVVDNPRTEHRSRWSQFRQTPQARPQVPAYASRRQQTFNRRVFERAPNSNVVCYRCGKVGHIQTFCRSWIPLQGFNPMSQRPLNAHDGGRRGHLERGSDDVRQWRGDRAHDNEVPSRSGKGRSVGRTFAVDTLEGKPSTDYVDNPVQVLSEKDKDAQIAALIERNNELANFAFATHEPCNSSDNPTDVHHERTGARSTSLPRWPVMCLFLLANLGICSAVSAPPAMICSNSAAGNYWRIPHEVNCTRILPSFVSDPVRVTLDVFRPNTVRYKTTATVCKIISQKVTYSVNFFGSRNQISTTSELTVTPEECKQMFNHRRCAHGDMTTVGTVMKTTNKLEIDWPTAPFHCCTDYEVSVYNCVAFETSVYAYHGASGVDSPAGPLTGCQYEDGSCIMKSGAAVIWQPTAEEACQFIFVATMKGTMADKVWLSDSKEFALSFSLKEAQFVDCKNSLIRTDQGYAVKITGIPRRSARSLETFSPLSQVGLATTNQLAAQLLAVEDNMQTLTISSFRQSALSLCKSMNSISRSMIAALASEPTLAMRKILSRPDIDAMFLGGDVIKTRPCVLLSRNMYRLQPFNDTCYTKPMIEVHIPGNKTWKAFLDPVTFVISINAEQVACKPSAIFEFAINNTVHRFDAIQNTWEKMKVQRLSH